MHNKWWRLLTKSTLTLIMHFPVPFYLKQKKPQQQKTKNKQWNKLWNKQTNKKQQMAIYPRISKKNSVWKHFSMRYELYKLHDLRAMMCNVTSIIILWSKCSCWESIVWNCLIFISINNIHMLTCKLQENWIKIQCTWYFLLITERLN